MVAVGESLSVNYAHSYPDASEWPNFVLKAFPPVAKSLIIGSITHGFNPLVKPEELSKFEEFYYEYYVSDPSFYGGIGLV